jgi:hypothetical protein
MDRTPSTSRTSTRLRERFGLRSGLASTLTAVVGLLVIGSIGVGLALRPHAVPPFDWQLSVGGVRSVAIHYGPVCQELPGIGAGACADYTPDLWEFTITYHTPQGDRTLVSALLPMH